MQKINNPKYSQVLLDATIFPLCEPTVGNTVCSRGLTKDYITQDNCDNAQVGNTRRHTKDYITQHSCNSGKHKEHPRTPAPSVKSPGEQPGQSVLREANCLITLLCYTEYRLQSTECKITR